MKSWTLALAVVLAIAGCRGKAKPRQAPRASFDLTIGGDDCLHHAVAVARVVDAWLVAGACGSEAPDGRERLIAVRVDDQGIAGHLEDVEVLAHGWATNVLLAAIDGGAAGALFGWTSAVDGSARAFVLPIDVQGRPSGPPVAVAPGRALAMAGGPSGVAVAVVTEPDVLSDDVDAPGTTLTVYTLDASGDATGRIVLSETAQAARPHVSLATRPGGYTAAWIERGQVLVAELGPHGEAGRRGIASPAPGAVGLPSAALFWQPAVLAGADGAARVAAVVSGGGAVSGGDPSGEVWLGEGVVGESATSWRWTAVARGRDARLGGLALAGGARGDGALAWSETNAGADFSSLALLRVPGGQVVSRAIAQAVLFDGAVALGVADRRVLLAGAMPPTETTRSGLALILR